MKHSFFLVVPVAWVLGLACHCQAVESWADPHLTVTQGLELWLDASRVSAAAAAHDRALSPGHQELEVWYDASGKRRDARQTASARQPKLGSDLTPDPAQAVVHFDGLADGLTISNGCGTVEQFTLFVVATPYSNIGRFRGFISANAAGKNDYETGFNLDLGGDASAQWQMLNVEGAGFGGQKNLLTVPLKMGTFHTISTTADANGQVAIFVDGRAQGTRARTAKGIQADEIRIGMRYYGEPGSQVGEGSFFDGCIAEVLLYRRALSDAERKQVENYLTRKYGSLLELKGPPPKPPVQMLVPGFAVRELPVKLTNINCVTYGPDGLLYVAGYDGRIHVLRDTDGDGVEDQAKVWWDKPTLRTPIAIAWRPDGLYVVSSGRISLLHDSTGSGRADIEEVIVADMPKDDGHTGGNVDALGIAFDEDNNLYFGLGCADYSNPYRLRDGKPTYDIASQRGTILKVSADRKHREIVCTGIRFPYSLAFNRAGDLFSSDQEGETWCPGGNPLDELNYIVPGRHYGFPPRDARYLPDVHDESPVVGFGPQHQSTCGFVFNEPSEHQPLFGPKLWTDDAFVCGFSRGKLWRARLAKTSTGYIGRETLIASLRFLTLSPTISPKGDLVVACHGGLPDWGTGPKGEGKLFKISYANPTIAQPALAWAHSPVEVRVAFDRPVEQDFIDTSRIHITYGEFVRAGDRFESLRPGYAAVEAQSHAFRGQLRVINAALSEDKRTLRVTTDPHPMQASYAISLPLRSPPAADRQEPVIELTYDLSGVAAEWTADGQSTLAWTGWLPHADLDVARRFTEGSADHQRLFELAQGAGTLRLFTSIRATSPELTLQFDTDSAVQIETDQPAANNAGPHAVLKCNTGSGPVNVTISLRKAVGPPQLHVAQTTTDDPTPRPLALASHYPTWAPRRLPIAPPAKAAAEIAGGNWHRGEALFFSAEANCAACHTVAGKGGHIGPDLSNLLHRDAASVLRDIVEPNAAINPDHIAYTLVLKDKRVLNGLVRTEEHDTLLLIDSLATETRVQRKDVLRLQASSISIMPEGYAKLGDAKLKDLLAFLTTARPGEQGPQRPVPRSRAEVESVLKLAGSALPKEKLRRVRIALVAGPKDHGPGEHDYPAWQKQWQVLLSKAPQMEVTTAFGRPEQKVWDSADVIIFYCWGPQFWDDASYKQLDAFLARGGGLVVLHSAVISDKEPQKFAELIGYAWIPQGSKFRHGDHELTFTDDVNPITRGYKKLQVTDEDYWPLEGKTQNAKVLATTPDDGGVWPMIWTYEHGKGRVFATILGHYLWTFDDPLSRLLILRGIAWSAGESADRLQELALEGVELTK
jgi:putative heme-binding domain-containing protein